MPPQSVEPHQRDEPDELDPQVEVIAYALSRLNRLMRGACGRQLTALGVTNAEWEVLRTLALAGQPYRLGPGDLAKRLHLTPAAMTHRVDRMVAEGLVTRARDESNRVRVNIQLTEDGYTKWLKAMRTAARFEADLVRDLSADERTALATMLTRMLDRAAAPPRPDGPYGPG